ncbi:Protein piccolo [Oopsacas minuta]|uniref:Protein piccolo n=1 Tax=Oopsacas minuta TaxID=111878 RepID=A0AAV7JX37_9METZ|nr:Protein piccolo [Oopsacas minuta]
MDYNNVTTDTSLTQYKQTPAYHPMHVPNRQNIDLVANLSSPSPVLPPYRLPHNSKTELPKSPGIPEKKTCHRTASQDSGLSTQRSTASSNSSTGQRPEKLGFYRNDSGLGLEQKPQTHTLSDIDQLCIHNMENSSIKQNQLTDTSCTGVSLSALPGLQFRRTASAAPRISTSVTSNKYSEDRKNSHSTLCEHSSPLQDSIPSPYRSDHGFIAYDTNNIVNYDSSPRKKYSDIIPPHTESPRSPRKTLESSCKLECTLTEENLHRRQASYMSGVSGQDSEEYDSDSLEMLGSSGWDTLYRMRSSFRSKHKEKENFSKSMEPRSSVINNLREVCILRTQAQYGFTLSRIAGIGDTVVELEDKSIASNAGLIAGDIIITINDQEVCNLTHRQVVELLLSIPVDYTLRLKVKAGISISKSPSMPLQLGTPTNNPLLDGYLYLLNGKKTWKKRWFVLREDRILYYYKGKGDKGALGAIILDGYVVSKSFDVKRVYSFNVKKGGGRPYCFSCDTEHQMINWAQAMADAAEYQDENRDYIIAPCMPNVAYSALSIKKPDMHGVLFRSSGLWSWKRRYCVLKNAQLFVYTKMSDTIAEDVLHLFGYRVQEGDTTGPRNFFHLFAPEGNGKESKDHTFYVESESERTRWLKSVISSIKNAFIPNASHSHS